jgi:hypothetical protein
MSAASSVTGYLRARKNMECTFGMLCYIFKVLGTAVNDEGMDNIIKCVYILHNFVRIKDGTVNQLFTLEDNPDADVITGPNIIGRSYSGPFAGEEMQLRVR